MSSTWGKTEFHDHATDPDELNNTAASLPAAKKKALHDTLAAIMPRRGVVLERAARTPEEGYLHVIGAEEGERLRAEPFDAVELAVGVLFGDDAAG